MTVVLRGPGASYGTEVVTPVEHVRPAHIRDFLLAAGELAGLQPLLTPSDEASERALATTMELDWWEGPGDFRCTPSMSMVFLLLASMQLDPNTVVEPHGQGTTIGALM